MTHLHDAPRRRWFAGWFSRGWFWSKIGLAAVLGIFIVSAAANFEAGQALSGDTATSVTLGLASICVDIMKAIAFFIVASAFINRRWWALCASLVMFGLCASWSMRSATQFMFSTLEQHAADKQLAADLQKTDMDVLGLKTARAGFLAQQKTQVSGLNRAARADAMEANKQTSAEFSALLKDIDWQRQKLSRGRAVVADDPLATVLNLPGEKVRTASAIIFALILEVVSSLGFWAIVQARTPKPPRMPQARVLPIRQEIQPVLSGPSSPSPTGGYEQEELAPIPDPAVLVPEPVLLPDNVTPLFPKKAASKKSLPTPDQDDISPTDEIRAVIRDLFEAKAEERSIYKSVVDLINAQLPNHKRIMSPHDYARVIMPAIRTEFPDVEKLKTGGRVYLYGLRPKSFESKASA